MPTSTRASSPVMILWRANQLLRAGSGAGGAGICGGCQVVEWLGSCGWLVLMTVSLSFVWSLLGRLSRRGAFGGLGRWGRAG